MLLLYVLLAASSFFPSITAFPTSASYEFQLKRAGVSSNITIPSPATNTGLKAIPDAAHPYIAPGSNDQRGPCPGLNTLANHGYLPRNGIASYADIVNGIQEGYNMEYGTASGIAAFGLLTRGNVLINKLSIGGVSPQVPPLPGNLDGIPGGLVKHGRFEGDVSFTRHDFALGDNKNFQPDLYDNLLGFQAKYGNGSIVTTSTLQQSKASLFNYSLANNPTFSFHEVRETFSFGEGSFMLNLFANGTEGVLTVPVMTSFFANETFPANWHRNAKPVDAGVVGATSAMIAGGSKPPPGAKTLAANTFQTKLTTHNVPAALIGPNASAQVKANTQAMLIAIKDTVGQGCPTATPSAPLET